MAEPVTEVPQQRLTSAEVKAQWKEEDQTNVRYELVWTNVIFVIGVHIAAVYAMTLMPAASWKTLALWPVLWVFTGMGVTAGVHRLWAHKSYQASLPIRVLLMLANSCAYQGSIFEWARDHRTHHKASETNGDPHDARRGFFFAHVGWVVVRKHPEVFRQGKTIDVSDLRADPVVMWQAKYYLATVAVMCYGLPTVLGALWGEAWAAFWIGGVFRHVFVLHMTWFVNSAAHLWGEQTYNDKIHPRENLLVSLGAMGEGWHNYHHALPWDYSASEWGTGRRRWNPTTLFIEACASVGLVWGLRKASHAMVDKMKTNVLMRKIEAEEAAAADAKVHNE